VGGPLIVRLVRMRSYIPDYSTLEDHPFFTELLSGNIKTAYKLAKSRALKQVIAEIGRAIDAKLKSANDASVVEEIRQYILSTDKFDRMIESIIKNQAKHMIKGLWTDEGGVKIFSNLVTRAIPFYRKDHPYSTHVPPRVSRSIKTKAGRALLDWYFKDIEEAVEDMGGGYEIQNLLVHNRGSVKFPKSTPKFMYYEQFIKLPIFKKVKKQYPEIHLHIKLLDTSYCELTIQDAWEEDNVVFLSFDVAKDKAKNLERDLTNILQPTKVFDRDTSSF